MAKRLEVPISSARARLFQLAELLRESENDAAVVLRQRGIEDGVALVRESRLAYLEARVSELERRAAPSFSLRGSLRSSLDDDSLTSAMRTIRAEWGARAEPDPARRRPPARRPRR